MYPPNNSNFSSLLTGKIFNSRSSVFVVNPQNHTFYFINNLNSTTLSPLPGSANNTEDVAINGNLYLITREWNNTNENGTFEYRLRKYRITLFPQLNFSLTWDIKIKTELLPVILNNSSGAGILSVKVAVNELDAYVVVGLCYERYVYYQSVRNNNNDQSINSSSISHLDSFLFHENSIVLEMEAIWKGGIISFGTHGTLRIDWLLLAQLYISLQMNRLTSVLLTLGNFFSLRTYMLLK